MQAEARGRGPGQRHVGHVLEKCLCVLVNRVDGYSAPQGKRPRCGPRQGKAGDAAGVLRLEIERAGPHGPGDVLQRRLHAVGIRRRRVGRIPAHEVVGDRRPDGPRRPLGPEAGDGDRPCQRADRRVVRGMHLESTSRTDLIGASCSIDVADVGNPGLDRVANPVKGNRPGAADAWPSPTRHRHGGDLHVLVGRQFRRFGEGRDYGNVARRRRERGIHVGRRHAVVDVVDSHRRANSRLALDVGSDVPRQCRDRRRVLCFEGDRTICPDASRADHRALHMCVDGVLDRVDRK